MSMSCFWPRTNMIHRQLEIRDVFLSVCLGRINQSSPLSLPKVTGANTGYRQRSEVQSAPPNDAHTHTLLKMIGGYRYLVVSAESTILFILLGRVSLSGEVLEDMK